MLCWVMVLKSVAPLLHHKLDYMKQRATKVYGVVDNIVKETESALQNVMRESRNLINSRT